MLAVDNITKSFANHVLFENITFKINSRERVGLVGRNGHGKTTLLKIIMGDEEADTGSIIVPKHYRIGYVRQHLDFSKDTVLEEGMTGLRPEERDHYWKVEKVLAGLGFSESDMQKHPEEFSGGFQVRLNLVKVIVSDPDLLLLDEPTNYLDITSIRWIERFLNDWPHELLLVTHDRSFMDRIVTHVVGIHRKQTRKIEGNTEKYYAQIAQDEEIYEKTRLKDARRRKDMELFIRRFRAKARLANMVQSRIKTLSKLEKREKLHKLETLDFSFRYQAYNGKYVLSVKNMSFAYEQQKPIINDLSVTIGARDRICVIGKNGKGKTTLLKLLTGVLQPGKGKVKYNPGVIRGFFEQTNIQSLVDTRTIEEEMLYAHSGVDRQLARNICGAMMFEGDDALKKISVLSGGEKSRVMLGKILAEPLNLLVLDEPSNHLDMESCDALLAALDNFDGAVVMVTHNEMFLHALAERLIVFQEGKTLVFEWSYQRFLDNVGWENEGTPVKSLEADKEVKDSRKKLTKKELKKMRSDIISQRSKALQPLRRSIKDVENSIESIEKELNQLNTDMQEASYKQDGKKIMTLSQAIHNKQSAIDRLFKKLEEFTDRYDSQQKAFNEELEQVDDSEDSSAGHRGN